MAVAYGVERKKKGKKEESNDRWALGGSERKWKRKERDKMTCGSHMSEREGKGHTIVGSRARLGCKCGPRAQGKGLG